MSAPPLPAPKESPKESVVEIVPVLPAVPDLPALESKIVAEPPAMPRAKTLIERELSEAEKAVDGRILTADNARENGRWEECLAWLGDAVSAVRDRKRLAEELRVAKVMEENHD